MAEIEDAAGSSHPAECPVCGRQVFRAEPSGAMLQCPECHAKFPAPGDSTEAHYGAAQDDELHSGEDAESARENDLSELRIRQISNLRRGAFRTRSWFVIGIVVCAVATIELTRVAIDGIRHGVRLGPAGEILFAAGALMTGGHFIRRVRELTAEISASRLPEPETPPDLSSLSDGSQQWDSLRELSGDTSGGQNLQP